MGTQTSSLVKSTSSETEEIPKLEIKQRGEGGPKVHHDLSEVSSDVFDSDSDTDFESDSDDEEVDEELAERLRILDDAKKLKALAVAFLHPEKPVEVDATACARCYFDRPSAPEQEDIEETEYRRQVLEDAAALKKLAFDYAHPEVKVVSSDATATARCYFDRASAPEQESLEEADYRHQVLADAAALKKLAIDYAHPEVGVESSDPTATARCYFDRASAPAQESLEETEYRRQVLADAAALKQLAVDYAHPELGVVTSDTTATARCYFDRASAPAQESDEEAEYRRQVLADAAALKQLAIDYAHPEFAVTTTDSAATARCYFDRASAPAQESIEETEYRRQVLADATALKQLAVDYAHPELGVVTSDPAATARCYFDRASAPVQESLEETEYHRQVLADAVALKELAVNYAHPEIGVVNTDASSTARCYFDRASAPAQESLEETEYRRQVLADAAALKQIAVDYAHPEFAVTTMDSAATARCYFDRASAPAQESLEETEYRRQVLADAIALKQLAVDYAHPEIGVANTGATATARCYFDRASAPEQESLEEVEYRRQVLEDAAALKQLAIDYAHPELGVVTSDPAATARCYFDRASGPVQESLEETEYRRQVLADATALKQLAVNYAHPEIGVARTDSASTARCYFDRPSAPQQESLEDAEYRRQVLEDAAALKQLAVDYAHPELGVVTSDPSVTARCYFDRVSAPQQEEKRTTPLPSVTNKTPPDTRKQVEIYKKKHAAVDSSTSVKTVDTSKNTADIGRSVSTVQLFGLNDEEDPSF